MLYDGATGNSYDSESLANMPPGTPTQDYQFYVWKPAEIQNGSPDGLALLANGLVIELLSYEGTFPVGGLAAGVYFFRLEDGHTVHSIRFVKN